MDCVTAEVPEEISVLFETDTSTPARAKRKPSIMPAGPPPTMHNECSTVPSAPLLGLRKHFAAIVSDSRFRLGRFYGFTRGGQVLSFPAGVADVFLSFS